MLAGCFGRREACSTGVRPVSRRIGNLSDVYRGQYTRGVARTLRSITPCTISEGPRVRVKPRRRLLASIFLQNQPFFGQKAAQSDRLCPLRNDELCLQHHALL